MIFLKFLLDSPAWFTYTHSSCWAVVQLAGRRILTPLIKVRVLAAQPTQTVRPHRLAGPGQRPFTPSTGVQIPLGTPLITRGLTKNLSRYPQGIAQGIALKKGCMKMQPFFIAQFPPTRRITLRQRDSTLSASSKPPTRRITRCEHYGWPTFASKPPTRRITRISWMHEALITSKPPTRRITKALLPAWALATSKPPTRRITSKTKGRPL